MTIGDKQTLGWVGLAGFADKKRETRLGTRRAPLYTNFKQIRYITNTFIPSNQSKNILYILIKGKL